MIGSRGTSGEMKMPETAASAAPMAHESIDERLGRPPVSCTSGRSSTAHSMKVCVPPPDAPVQPSLSESTSGREVTKSIARMLFHSCLPPKCNCWYHGQEKDKYKNHQKRR